MNRSRALAGAASTALIALVLAASAAVADARTVYVTNSGSGSISALAIAADGSLAPVAGSPFAAVPQTAALSMGPDGSTLIAARYNNPGAFTAFTPGSGGSLSLKPGTPPASGNSPRHSTIEPTGRFAYVSNNAGAIEDRDISGYALAGADMPTSLGPKFEGFGINLTGVVASVDGRFVYVGTNLGSGVLGYSVGAGGHLEPLPGSPFNLGMGASLGLVVSPDGRFLFAGDWNNHTIVTAAIAADGKLTPVGAPAGLGPASKFPSNLAMTPDGRRLYAANGHPTDYSISSFAVDGAGSLTPVGSPVVTTAPPRGVAVTPDGRRLYAALSSGGANVLGFAIAADGALSQLPGSPYASGGDNSSGGAEQALAIAPNQGPRAAFAAKAKSRTSRTVVFDGAGSTDSDGKVATYEWDFGDGKTATSATPKVEHDYADLGTYQAKLRVVDDEGCSTAQVYTGQATLCNGGPAAVATVAVTVDIPPVVSGLKIGKKTRKGKLAGLTVSFRVSEPGTARVGIERKAAGRRVGGRCVKQKPANRKRPRCDRYESALSRPVNVDKAGAVSLKLGKKAVKRLRPGTYRAAVRARDTTGQWSVGWVYKTFKVAKPKPKVAKPKSRR